MPFWSPDPTFYPSARLAMEAPAERHAFVAALNPKLSGKHDAICVVDVAPDSPGYGKVVGRVEMPNAGDEVHHFGWNACSSALCPYAPHPYLERRYLIIPGLRSSRLYIVDTKHNPRMPRPHMGHKPHPPRAASRQDARPRATQAPRRLRPPTYGALQAEGHLHHCL